jgi:fused signal recognition particle receptor
MIVAATFAAPNDRIHATGKMFSFFKKKTEAATPAPLPTVSPDALPAAPLAAIPPALDMADTPGPVSVANTVAMPAPMLPQPQADTAVAPPSTVPAKAWWKAAVSKLSGAGAELSVVPVAPPALDAVPVARPPGGGGVDVAVLAPVMPAPPAQPTPAPAVAVEAPAAPSVLPSPVPSLPAAPAGRQRWLDKLRNGLRKTGSNIAQVFTGTQINDALYEELESALLMADTGVRATEFLLQDLRRRVKDSKASDPARVKGLLADALTELLTPLEKPLEVGQFQPTVMMVVGVNGAGKTTSIGKLTRHLADAEQTVLLAAADTFRAAAREQLAVWADRNRVEIVSNEGADPAAVAFDAVTAGKARRRDVVIADTAGRLPTQIHLMEELRKIKRVIAKADAGAPHEVLLVVDGNTGQNALTQVKAFDDALGLTGLIVTKLDGTAKGGVLAAIARERPVPVYFIGVGEKLEDLQTFNAREFAQALLA